MTHTTTTIAMQISKATRTHTSLSKLVLVIIFFTLLRAAWLLHSSQSTKTSCDITDFFSPPTFSILSLTMAPVQSKDTNSVICPCLDSPHSKNQIMATPRTKGPSISSLTNLSWKQIAVLVSPENKGIFSTAPRVGW